MEKFSTHYLNKFKDNRGFFYESFSRDLSKQMEKSFVQDNISFSKAGVIRGLHYQWDEPMGKLIHVISGSIIDHIVDIRENSEYYGKSYKFELNDKNSKILWVPPGYAHGFEALQDSVVMYKCTSYYNQIGEGCINFFDKNLNLNLIIDQKDVIISEKDKKGVTWEEYKSNPKF
tara:strand:+ start:2979 stop:3500 length:522 start_codon:yes stop_codon:yes gene_type:complete